MFDWFKRAERDVPERKASATGPVVAMSAGIGRPAWSPRDAVSLTKNGFLGNVIAFRCVRMIAEAAASAPLALSDGERTLLRHPVQRLLRAPNQGQLGAEFLEAVYGHLLLAGDAYVEAAGRRSDGAPLELFALRPDRMRVVPGADGWPSAYEYAVGGRKVRFSMGEELKPLLHLRSFHPMDDHYGLSALQAAATSLDIHAAAAKWSKALLDNAARPSGAIVYKGAEGASLSDEQYRRLMDEVESNHQGARNAGRPMLLEGGLDWKPMGFSPSDMEFLQTKTAAARDVAIAFGVPPMLLGLPGDATYANYQEANRAFWRQTVLPMVRKVSGALAVWLSDWMGEELVLAPDMDAIPALAEERRAQWKAVADADFLTDDEKRRLLGLPAREA